MPEREANATAIDALKQVLTLSSLILALTVTFIKDALGDSRSLADLTFLVPLAWFFLTLSIWSGWISMADAGRLLAGQKEEAYVFGSGLARRLARTAQWSFLLALLCLGSFAIVNFDLFFTDGEASANTPRSP